MTDAELTILCIVAEGARYGNEIQKIIEERGLREWLKVGFSSIFYILNKLEQQQLISGEMRSDGQLPPRKVYHLTDAGRGVLQTSIVELLRQPRPIGSGIELGLANISSLKPRQVYKALSDHCSDLKARLNMIERSWERHQAEDPEIADHIRALYTHSIALMRAELDWMTQFVADWVQRYPAVVRSDTDQIPAVKLPPGAMETQLHRRVTPDAAKVLQQLKRPKPPTEE